MNGYYINPKTVKYNEHHDRPDAMYDDEGRNVTARYDPLVPNPAPTTYIAVPPEVQPNAELSENEA